MSDKIISKPDPKKPVLLDEKSIKTFLTASKVDSKTVDKIKITKPEDVKKAMLDICKITDDEFKAAGGAYERDCDAGGIGE